MPPMDYNRKFTFDEDDEDDGRRPRVTKLDGPSTITLGAQQPPAPAPPAGVSVRYTNQGGAGERSATEGASGGKAMRPPPRAGLDYSKWDTLDVASSDEEMDEAGRPDEMDEDDPLTPEEQQRLGEVMKQSFPRGGPAAPPYAGASTAPSADAASSRFEALRAQLSRNGAERDGYLWRQSESEAELSVLLPPGTRARSVDPQLISLDLASEWRDCAEGLGLKFNTWDVNDGDGLHAAAGHGETIDLCVISYVYYHYMSNEHCADWIARHLNSGRQRLFGPQPSPGTQPQVHKSQ